MTRPTQNPFEAAKLEAHEALASTVTRALSRKGYEAVFALTKEDALAEVLKLIPEGAVVGIPGTVTIREIGAMEKLEPEPHPGGADADFNG